MASGSPTWANRQTGHGAFSSYQRRGECLKKRPTATTIRERQPGLRTESFWSTETSTVRRFARARNQIVHSVASQRGAERTPEARPGFQRTQHDLPPKRPDSMGEEH